MLWEDARPRRAARTLRWVTFGVIALVSTACGVGTWTLNATPAPVRAVHAALLANGHVLLIQGSGNDPDLFDAGTFTTTEWDPIANTFTAIDTPYDMFCAGHAFLPDGSLLVAGGTTGYPDEETDTDYSGSSEAYRFDATTHRYVQVPDLASGHWYPTLVARGDGSVIAVAGLDENSVLQSDFQIFDPAADEGTGSWSEETASAQLFPTYPALHLLADGRFLYSGVSTFGVGDISPGIWNATANTYTPVPGLTDLDRRDMGASVLLPPAQDQKVMVMGGGRHDVTRIMATNTTAIIDMKSASPTFVPGPPIRQGKQYLSAVILPDRTVLQSGGSNTTMMNRDKPVFKFRYSAQIYHPDTQKWEEAAASKVGRTYHSEALLLPDGRVATFGGNFANDRAEYEMRIEVYTPDYVDKVRPTLSVDPESTTLTRGMSATFQSDVALKWVELVRPSAVTHSNDPDQRLVDLPFTQTGTSVTANLDANPNLTPPGWYMLFGVDTAGTPSVATWVKVV